MSNATIDTAKVIEALKVAFVNMDSNGDPIGAQPELGWESGYAAGLRFVVRTLKARGIDLGLPEPK